MSDTLYYIAEDGVVRYEPEWTHTETGCPFTYEVGRMVDGVERPLTPDEQVVLVHDDSNGHLRLETGNYALDGEIWTIRLYMRSTYSKTAQQDGAHVFDIEFRDICWDS